MALEHKASHLESLQCCVATVGSLSQKYIGLSLSAKPKCASSNFPVVVINAEASASWQFSYAAFSSLDR